MYVRMDRFPYCIITVNEFEWRLLPHQDGQLPARWRHSATVLENGNILVFGGFMDKDIRLNDCWIFDIGMCSAVILRGTFSFTGNVLFVNISDLFCVRVCCLFQCALITHIRVRALVSSGGIA